MSGVVIYDAALNRLLKGLNGPVARVVDSRADRILAAAGARIGTRPEERSGDLRQSLRKTALHQGPDGEVHVHVGADSHHTHGKSGPFPYALALETGVDPLSGRPMNYTKDFAYMRPAVRDAGFRPRTS